MPNPKPLPRSTSLWTALGLAAALSFGTAGVATAQNIDFQVDNITLEQTVSSAQALEALSFGANPGDRRSGSDTLIFQQGQDNSARTGILDSNGAFIGTLQVGDRNSTQAAIIDSPGSKIASVQVGDDNSALIGIAGGADNTAAVAQVGSGLTARVGLQNSTGTTLTFGQAGTNHNGGIVIKNAPRGTRIRID